MCDNINKHLVWKRGSSSLSNTPYTLNYLYLAPQDVYNRTINKYLFPHDLDCTSCHGLNSTNLCLHSKPYSTFIIRMESKVHLPYHNRPRLTKQSSSDCVAVTMNKHFAFGAVLVVFLFTYSSNPWIGWPFPAHFTAPIILMLRKGIRHTSNIN